MKNLVKLGVLAMGASLIAGCGGASSSPEATTPTSSTSFSISGTLSNSLMLKSDTQAYKFLGSSLRPLTVTIGDLIVSCVTFSVPPIAGSGGDVAADGTFTVSFGEGAKGKNFGCFITATDPTFDPIPMVFVDSTKKSMDGEASQSSRLAVTDSISIPSIALDLDEKTAEVNVATIVSATNASQTGSSVLAGATGTKLDFTGEWVVADPVAEGIALPAGYRGPLTYADILTDEKGGPIKNMHLYMFRMAAKKFAVTNQTACDAAQAGGEHNPDTLLAGACTGTTTTEDIYGIQLWGPNMDALFSSGPPASEADLNTVLAGASAEAQFNACNRLTGMSLAEAKIFGGVDLSTDANYLAGAGGTTAGKYYVGPFVFASSLNMSAHADKNNIFGSGKSLQNVGSDYTSALTEGWKFTEAQNRWSGQNCISATRNIGGKDYPVWRCYGKYASAHTTDFSAIPENAYRDQLGGGCYRTADNTPINFANWTDFWSGSPTYTNLTTFAGVTLPTGMWGGKYVRTAFQPKDSEGANMGAAGDIACENYEGFYNMSDNLAVADPADSCWKGDDNHFQYTTIGAADSLCSAMSEASEQLKLIKLQCYANAYWEPSRYLTGCLRQVQFNFNANDSWNFVEQNGPAKTKTRFIMELFNYSANDSGSFTSQDVYTRGFRVQDAAGMNKWVNCRVRENMSISMTAINGSTTKLLVDMTSVVNLIDTFNGACVAEAEKADSQLGTGTTKLLFVLNKQ